MQTTETLFERELTKLITARISDMQIMIGTGSLQSFEEYKSKCGMVDGLQAAIEMMDEARALADQRSR